MHESSLKFDLIVIGGGATGSGIALDASLRGLNVLLLEQNDFAEGTSSRSTKLAHGGVRYLEYAVKHLDKEQYSLVKEGLKERYRLLRNISHLSKKISLITPIYRWWEVPYVYIGLKLYDMISGKYSIGKSSLLSKKEALSINPNIKKEGLKACVKYFDGAFNDARAVIALVQSANEKGATVKNYTQVQNFIFQNDTVCGVEAYDKIAQKSVKYYAKYIVNATGVFADTLRKLADKNAKEILRPSSGIHIVLDKKFLPSKEGLMIPKTKDDRVLFVLPYLGKCLVGTTDKEDKVTQHPEVSDEDIEYLLEHINGYFDMKVTKEDIQASFCGLRPLVDLHKDEDSSELVREHIIEELPCGLLTITGGKWTTYRSMSEELVDILMKKIGSNKTSSTKEYKLVGSRLDQEKIYKKALEFSDDNEAISRLVSLYGDRAVDILKIAKEEAGFGYLDEKYKILKAEYIYSQRYEYVKKPIDFVSRRACISFVDRVEEKKILDKIDELF
ncbi:MAG: FAD-dependent oxidoreductase [Epsilonproteobacteria bacterium]|nr:FAD-dependent oxidoreductase [Campylobacterota bacterium]